MSKYLCSSSLNRLLRVYWSEFEHSLIFKHFIKLTITEFWNILLQSNVKWLKNIHNVISLGQIKSDNRKRRYLHKLAFNVLMSTPDRIIIGVYDGSFDSSLRLFDVGQEALEVVVPLDQKSVAVCVLAARQLQRQFHGVREQVVEL